MHTLRLPDFDGINAELGALYYLPQRHRLLRTVIRALRRTPREWRRPRQGPPTYYLRGRRLHTSDLNTYKLPYRLADGEKHMQPADLRRYVSVSTCLDFKVASRSYAALVIICMRYLLMCYNLDVRVVSCIYAATILTEFFP